MTEPARPRRFYEVVSVEPVDGGFALRLDGRSGKTAGGKPLVAPTLARAELIASEWDGQAETIDFSRMPATRLAFTAIDRTPEARAGLANEVAAYAGSDLLCYIAEHPTLLAEQEVAAWGPWLAWAERELGVALRPSLGIAHAPQPEASLARVKALAEAMDDFALTGLVYAAGLYGSAVLALAVVHGALDAGEAFELSRLDEAFQQERWGVDEEAAQRTEGLRTEAAMIGRWFAS
ncbi:MAG: ATPase [Caulobacterales bacterium 32-69-10]|nr:MAG: ATPase [Caulobacterales bacterium 32-69-10]